MPQRLLTALLCAALNLPSLALAESTATTPTSNEMSPTAWRRAQLEAADKSDRIMKDAQRQPGLLGQYEFMQLKYNSNHDRAFQLIFGQYLSWFQTYIGDYNGARRAFSIAQPAQGDDGPSPQSGGYAPKPAAEAILALTKDRKAVFFNEAHSAPISRTLTVELLPKLREQGFNYFAAETLYETDKDLNKRGYPTEKTGFYTNEPLYGEMVRTALKLGFKVVAYDVENAGVGDARERAGADSLYSQVFKKDPNARLIVNAGFAHIQKSGKYLGGSSMAEFFQKVSGIDPLCIEQTMMMQHARTDQDHPHYVALMATGQPAGPQVYVNAQGKPWTLKPGEYDVSVVFPPYTANGRPPWAALGGQRMPYPVEAELCRGVLPCLIEARYANEGDDAIPADRARLASTDDGGLSERLSIVVSHNAASELYLRPGNYRLSATDARNRVLFTRDIVVGTSGVAAGGAQ
jgi:hypothetical protein